jgi:hypothetical protein
VQPHWLLVLAAAQHNGEAMKSFIQGWTGPLFLAGIGAAALFAIFGEGGLSKVLRIAFVGIAIAILIWQPEVLRNIGTFVAGLF